MVNALARTRIAVEKMHDVIFALNNNYNVIMYSPELFHKVNEYGFNILPENIVTRVNTSERDLKNIMIDIFMYYVMSGDDEYKESWLTFLDKADSVIEALYDKNNFPSGFSDLIIDVGFTNGQIERSRTISLTLQCEYRIFATR